MRVVSVIAVLIVAKICFAQNSVAVDGSDHCDCKKAWYTEDAILDSITMPSGYGAILEVSGNNIKNIYLPTKEHNALWIRIRFLKETEFEFQLEPLVPTDDFDFSVWKVNGKNFCDSILKGALPIRSNLSRRDPPTGSVTGLRKGAGRNFAAAGPNPVFSNSIKVNEGEEYILLIDAPYGAEGAFSTRFEYERLRKPDSIKPAIVVEEPKDTRQLFIRVVNENGENLSDVKVSVKNVPNGDSVYEIGEYHVLSRIQRYRNYTIDVEKKNYLSLRESYMSEDANPDTIDLHLERLRIGSKLQFQNIMFVPDKAIIVESSYLDLRRIRNFLKSNPNINVEIMGHVNGLGNKKKVYRELSKQRARAIYDYLIDEGIFADRLSYAGYGAAQLIYANPQNENEARINRRVEVKITKI